MGEKTNNKPLTIGQLARLSAVGIETIRFYERKGLIHKPMRSASGYRLFDEKALKTIKFIRRAKALGLSLREIKELLFLPEENGCEKVNLKILRKIAELDNKIRDLERIKQLLEQLVSHCQNKIERDDCPILRSLKESEL
ncbi:heavy metal-responsive transcriptional regulator [Methylacidiphilum caldifontis]|uniref:MerR family transcriptional regulator n=1 Tax=Methylacidiphilum caldifontis TaxID=2795386 RepID=A0A4Y8PC16_9BACT|nr:heavy metal-responsive transcriptional regulator [Methylacidiphilum caldifontis]QSR89485.1 heavy metal-responsive transcriptional regulator [Methylacidiphilum caldifontis]TFE67263.1 MerR family transcriptional regulator [Methylacidiphilum caldifontis]